MAEFVYLNANPDKSKESDCVTRAISLATGYPYAEIRRKLFHTAKLLNCEKLCVCCYRHLIEDVFDCKPMFCENMSVEEFADRNPLGVFLVRMGGHISSIIDNTIYDIWDCRKQILTDAWLVEL